MIFDRLYNPQENELIYHYCGPKAFFEIVKSRSIWLSASYTLNDVTERSWGYSVFIKVVKRMETEVGAEFVRKISEPVMAGNSYSLLMIGCFSLDADVLSQWRAYGDDGRGFAIGFSPRQMQVPAKSLMVLYDENDQIQELMGNLRHIHKVEKAAGFTYRDEFQNHLFNIGLDLCAYKNPAFREEREIQLAHFCGLDRTSKAIVPAGARDQQGNRLCDPLKIHFRVSKGVLAPYVIVDYSNDGMLSPIKEVVLGPRNENAELNIDVFLNTIGIRGVAVRRSDVPYRP